MPDITESLAPKSDQLDAVDLADGPRDFTITSADYRPGAEQPVTVHLAEFDRPWKPGKNMRRVLASCLTKDTDNWAGRRVRLFCDHDVVFAGVKVGGIRVSHVDIDKPISVPLILTKGKSVMYPVQKLPKAAPKAPELTELTEPMIACCTDQEQLRTWWNEHPGQRAAIEARKAELDAFPDGGDQS